MVNETQQRDMRVNKSSSGAECLDNRIDLQDAIADILRFITANAREYEEIYLVTGEDGSTPAGLGFRFDLDFSHNRGICLRGYKVFPITNQKPHQRVDARGAEGISGNVHANLSETLAFPEILMKYTRLHVSQQKTKPKGTTAETSSLKHVLHAEAE